MRVNSLMRRGAYHAHSVDEKLSTVAETTDGRAFTLRLARLTCDKSKVRVSVKGLTPSPNQHFKLGYDRQLCENRPTHETIYHRRRRAAWRLPLVPRRVDVERG